LRGGSVHAVPLRRLVDPVRPITYGIVQCGPDVEEGVPYIRPVDMDQERGVTRELQRAAAEIEGRYRRSRVGAGDIIVSIGPSFGKVMVVAEEHDGANLTQGTARVAPSSDVDPRFLFWALRSRPVENFWAAEVSGATFRALTLKALGATPIPFPPGARQRHIADFLDRETAHIDTLIEKKERLIRLLDEKRAALITHAVTKGLNPDTPMKDSGVEWIGKIPEHWDMRPVSAVSQTVTSGSRAWGAYYDDDGEIFLRIGNLSSGRIGLDLQDVARVKVPDTLEARRTRVASGDALISITALIGAAAFVPDGIPKAYVNQHLALVRPTRHHLDGRWLAYFTISTPGRRSLAAMTYGGTKQGLSLSDVRRFSVPLPPLEEQQQITGNLEVESTAHDAAIGGLRRSIALLRERRAALITAAVTGQLDIPETPS
jgi:type I restriction enzyme, S subunit